MLGEGLIKLYNNKFFFLVLCIGGFRLSVKVIHDFRIPRLILTGAECRERIGIEAKALGGKKAFIVTDEGVKGLGYEE